MTLAKLTSSSDFHFSAFALFLLHYHIPGEYFLRSISCLGRCCEEGTREAWNAVDLIAAVLLPPLLLLLPLGLIRLGNPHSAWDLVSFCSHCVGEERQEASFGRGMLIQNTPAPVNLSSGGNSQETAGREGMVGLAHFQSALSEVWKDSFTWASVSHLTQQTD